MGSDKISLGCSTPPANKKNPKDPKKNPITNQMNGIGLSEQPVADKKNSKITKTNPISNQKSLAYGDVQQRN
jgi:hypothetical protein